MVKYESESPNFNLIDNVKLQLFSCILSATVDESTQWMANDKRKFEGLKIDKLGEQRKWEPKRLQKIPTYQNQLSYTISLFLKVQSDGQKLWMIISSSVSTFLGLSSSSSQLALFLLVNPVSSLVLPQSNSHYRKVRINCRKCIYQRYMRRNSFPPT